MQFIILVLVACVLIAVILKKDSPAQNNGTATVLGDKINSLEDSISKCHDDIDKLSKFVFGACETYDGNTDVSKDRFDQINKWSNDAAEKMNILSTSTIELDNRVGSIEKNTEDYDMFMETLMSSARSDGEKIDELTKHMKSINSRLKKIESKVLSVETDSYGHPIENFTNIPSDIKRKQAKADKEAKGGRDYRVL